jgi:16S rRNA (guanine527-N7)-methyltransferase
VYYIATSNTTPLPDRAVRAALEPYGVTLGAPQVEAVRRHIHKLLLWNQRLNLTSITDPEEILRRHFGESMFAARFLPNSQGRLADLGSGAGFPGLALKIVRPELRIKLIESNAKKAAFLSEVKRDLQLEEVEIIRSRFEDLRFSTPFADYIAVRALGNLPGVLHWSARALFRHGLILLWLGADDALRVSRSRAWTWREVVPLPESRRRVLLMGSPVRD